MLNFIVEIPYILMLIPFLSDLGLSYRETGVSDYF